MSYAGMTIEQAAQQIGKPPSKAAAWLKGRGYRWDYGTRLLRRPLMAQEVADETNARIQAMRPQTSCFYCGSRGECRHR